MSMISLTINNKLYGPLEVDPEVKLIDFLHEYLNLTGTKFGCGQGVCQACTILIDNEDGTSDTARSCISNAIVFNGKKLRTIEGHAETNKQGDIIALHPVQEAFVENFSFQCGWCTSGFTNKTVALVEKLKRNPIAKDQVQQVIETELKDHVCRCTGYVKYYKAVKKLILSTEGATI